MKKLSVVFALSVLALSWGGSVFGQTAAAAQSADPGITANGVIGEVVAVDAASKQIFVRTDAGSVVIITVADSTSFKRINPSDPSADKAAAMTFAEIGAGDRVLARGRPSDDRKTLAAPRMIFVSTKADLLAKQEAERAEWKRRGIVGVVSGLNPQTKEITLQTRGPQGPQPVVIPVTEKVKLRRYAPDTVKFADAKPSTFEEIKVGDQLRAKGDRSEDGARFTPEEVVTGSFRTAIGTITAVNPEKNELTITQMQGNQPLTIVVSKDSVLKRVPAEAMAMMGGGRPGTPAGGAPGAQGAPPAGAAPGGGPQRPSQGGPGGGMRGMDIQQVFENLPPTTVAELKPGSMVIIASTVGVDPSRVTATQLVDGVGPIMAMMAGRAGGGRGPGGPGALSAGGAAGLGIGFGIGTP
jgi:hypothetical protein